MRSCGSHARLAKAGLPMWPPQIKWPRRGMPPTSQGSLGWGPSKAGPPQPAYVGGGIYTNSKQGEWTEQGGDVPVIGTHSHHYGIQ